ncbi:MAG: hypothetical protein ABI784_09785 [Ginsengibacter sp.]
MTEIKKIFIKILLLVLDILVFGWYTIKKIILPGRNRKGNILSSLFTFFTGIVDRLNYFQHGTFNLASFTRRRYVRQTILIVGGILFLLSLFEWTGDQKLNYSPTRYTEQLPSAENNAIANDQSDKLSTSFVDQSFKINYKNSCPSEFFSFTVITSVKKYLLVMSLRI